MKSKTCTKCGETSYSASDYGSWICPYCGEELKN